MRKVLALLVAVGLVAAIGCGPSTTKSSSGSGKSGTTVKSETKKEGSDRTDKPADVPPPTDKTGGGTDKPGTNPPPPPDKGGDKPGGKPEDKKPPQ